MNKYKMSEELNDFYVQKMIDQLNSPASNKCTCKTRNLQLISTDAAGFSDSAWRTVRCLDCKKVFREWFEG